MNVFFRIGIMGLLGVSGVMAKPNSSGYLPAIPVGSLRDPLGNVHTSTGKLTRSVVVIFSVPTPSQGGNQRRWSEALADNPQTRLPKSVGLFLVEDMKQSGFGEMAREEMKKKFNKNSRPVLLLDETGEVRKRFRIPRDATCVLVYDRNNKLVHSEQGNATEDAVARVRRAALQVSG
jgi:hypothetical protein